MPFKLLRELLHPVMKASVHHLIEAEKFVATPKRRQQIDQERTAKMIQEINDELFRSNNNDRNS